MFLKKKLIRAYLVTLRNLFTEIQFPLTHSSPFNLFVAVFLSANTTDRQVNKVMEVLDKRLRAPEDYVKIPLEELEGMIRSVGLYKQKAKRLKECAKIILEKHNGKIPDKIEKLLELPGVGRKIANVVLQWLYGKQEGIIVDTHVARLSRILGLSDSKAPEKVEKDLMQIVPKKLWRDFSMRLILYGQNYCPARPHDHYNCPLTVEIRKFFKNLNLAIVGFSFNEQKYGYKIFKDLSKEGFKVYPVNPKGGRFEGVKVYRNLRELSSKVGKIDLPIFVVKPEVSLDVLEEAKKLGISSIWFQPGSADKEVIEKAKELSLEYFNFCFMVMNGLW